MFLTAGGPGGAPACFGFKNAGIFGKIKRNRGEFLRKIKKIAFFTVYGNSCQKIYVIMENNEK